MLVSGMVSAMGVEYAFSLMTGGVVVIMLVEVGVCRGYLEVQANEDHRERKGIKGQNNFIGSANISPKNPPWSASRLKSILLRASLPQASVVITSPQEYPSRIL